MKPTMLYSGGIGILILVKLWLVSNQPLVAFADGGHDDLLFIRLANYLAQFDWLGPYDNLTLIKGPFYPLWIAVAFLAGVPLLLSQHLLYIAACLVTERALQPLIPSRPWRMAIFVLLLFNPVTFTWQLTRVLRDGLYPGLVLLVVGSAIGLFARRHEPARCLAGWAVTCGSATAAFWLTREEGVWILPVLAPLLIWTLAVVVFSNWLDWRKIVVVVLPLALPILAIQAVSLVNWTHYGVYAAVELKTPEFKAAYGALTRVRPAEYKLQVPVTKETLLRIYQESAAFAELRPSFEREGWTFRMIGLKNHPSGSDEIGGGWFIWALRVAVTEAGHFGSGAQAAGFFQRLADEVNTACQEKRLDCLAERASLTPPWRSEYLAPVIEKSISGFSMLATFSQVSPDPVPSTGTLAHLLLFQDMTREQLSGRGTMARAQGWVVHASGKKLTAALVEPDFNRVVSPAWFDSSPDVYQHFLRANQDIASANNARFEVGGRCVRTCVLRVSDESGTLADIPLKKGPWFAGPLSAFIDEVSSDVIPPWARLEELKLSLLKKIAVAYQSTIPYLVIATLGAISLWLFQSIRRRRFTTLGLIATSIAAAICMRLLMLAIIDITSFDAVKIAYMSPLYPLWLLCCGLFAADAGQYLCDGVRPAMRRDDPV